MKAIKTIFIIFISIFVLLSAFVLLNGWHIEFSEEEPITYEIEYGEKINIEILSAYLKGKYLFKNGKKLDVKTTHNIDESKLGTYEIKHRTSFWILGKEVTSYCNIADTKPPEITLNTDKNHYTLPDEEYEEEGFTAYDNYDGDVTDKVTSYIENGIVYYTVSDSSGNVATNTRKIVYKDISAPTLILLGRTTVFLEKNETFVEPGYSVFDDCDEDVANKVIIESNLNTEITGEYQIVYSVKDNFGNLATKTRIVIVEDPKEKNEDNTEIISDDTTEIKDEIETEEENEDKTEETKIVEQNNSTTPEKVIYLTFDDGPSQHTKELLEILKKHNVKATFFVVNSTYNDVLSEIYNDGHSIGIHSYTHSYKDIYANEKAYFDDLNKIKEVIYNKTGYKTNLVRFPGGSSNSVSKQYNEGIMTRLSKILEDQGYQYFDWNVGSGDAGETTSTEKVYQNVISGIESKNTAIVLQHDTKKFSIDAVEKIIIWGKENGYTFLPLTTDSPTSHHKIYN